MCLCSSWVFIRAAGVEDGLLIIEEIFRHKNVSSPFYEQILSQGLTLVDFAVIAVGIVSLLFVANIREKGIDVREKIMRLNPTTQFVFALSVIFLIVIAGIYGPGYSATEFIYKQFCQV